MCVLCAPEKVVISNAFTSFGPSFMGSRLLDSRTCKDSYQSLHMNEIKKRSKDCVLTAERNGVGKNLSYLHISHQPSHFLGSTFSLLPSYQELDGTEARGPHLPLLSPFLEPRVNTMLGERVVIRCMKQPGTKHFLYPKIIFFLNIL